jgi:hypothetical protein
MTEQQKVSMLVIPDCALAASLSTWRAFHRRYHSYDRLQRGIDDHARTAPRKAVSAKVDLG